MNDAQAEAALLAMAQNIKWSLDEDYWEGFTEDGRRYCVYHSRPTAKLPWTIDYEWLGHWWRLCTDGEWREPKPLIPIYDQMELACFVSDGDGKLACEKHYAATQVAGKE